MLSPGHAQAEAARASCPLKDFYSYGNDTRHADGGPDPSHAAGWFSSARPAVAGNAAGASPSLPRVAGIIFDDGVHAILEYPNSQGQSESVKPGDRIDGVGRVVSIDNDGINVKSDSGQHHQHPRHGRRGRRRAPAHGGAGGVSRRGGGYPGGPGVPPRAPGAFQPGQPQNPNGNF